MLTTPVNPGYNKIVAAEGTEARRNQIIDIVLSRFNLSESHFSGVRNKLPRLYDLWRGTWSGSFHPHKNNVHIPLIASAIWADVARKASTSLGQYPIVSFQGFNPNDASIARKTEALITAQMRDDDIYRKQVDFLLQADLYGVAVEQIGWRRTEEMRILEAVDRAPLTNQLIKSIKKGNVVTFDGPESETIDLLDFFPQPGVKHISKMKWVIKRYYLDMDEVRALTAAGVFDKAEVARMEREGSVGARAAADSSSIRRFSTRVGMDDSSTKWLDKYNTPVEFLEMWGVIPSELSQDGVLQRVITVANRRYLFRNKPNPFWHGQIPFLQFSPMPDPHYFYACGKAEAIEKLQITANRFLNQSLDAAELLIDPVWFYNREANINTRNMVVRPGKFIGVDGNPGAVVAPLQSNLNNLVLADNKISQVRDFAQMGTGISEDGIAGLGGDGRQTAREFVGRREAAGTRLALEARLYEEGLLEPHANLMVALNKQFLDMPTEVTILGDNAMTDPTTGAQLPATKVELDYYDMLPNYMARATGAANTLSKMTKQQSYVQLLQAMGTPLGQAAVGTINAVAFWKQIFKDFDIQNINEIFQQTQPLQQMMQQGGFSDPSQVPSPDEAAANPIEALLQQGLASGPPGAGAPDQQTSGPPSPLMIPGMAGGGPEQVPSIA